MAEYPMAMRNTESHQGTPECQQYQRKLVISPEMVISGGGSMFATANYLELVRIAITERRDISTAELLVFLHTCQLSAVDV